MNKGERTKNRILDAAMELFCEKGYVAVTMTAIKEATDLSIGGVYKYFKSTKDIFLGILARDEENVKTDVNPFANMNGEEILQYSFEKNFEFASHGQLGWVVAMYEFMLCEKEYILTVKERHRSCVEFNKMMIANTDKPHFNADILESLAMFTVIYLNGLQITAITQTFTKDEVAQQIKIFRHLLFSADMDLE